MLHLLRGYNAPSCWRVFVLLGLLLPWGSHSLADQFTGKTIEDIKSQFPWLTGETNTRSNDVPSTDDEMRKFVASVSNSSMRAESEELVRNEFSKLSFTIISAFNATINAFNDKDVDLILDSRFNEIPKQMSQTISLCKWIGNIRSAANKDFGEPLMNLLDPLFSTHYLLSTSDEDSVQIWSLKKYSEYMVRLILAVLDTQLPPESLKTAWNHSSIRLYKRLFIDSSLYSRLRWDKKSRKILINSSLRDNSVPQLTQGLLETSDLMNALKITLTEVDYVTTAPLSTYTYDPFQLKKGQQVYSFPYRKFRWFLSSGKDEFDRQDRIQQARVIIDLLAFGKRNMQVGLPQYQDFVRESLQKNDSSLPSVLQLAQKLKENIEVKYSELDSTFPQSLVKEVKNPTILLQKTFEESLGQDVGKTFRELSNALDFINDRIVVNKNLYEEVNSFIDSDSSNDFNIISKFREIIASYKNTIFDIILFEKITPKSKSLDYYIPVQDESNTTIYFKKENIIQYTFIFNKQLSNLNAVFSDKDWIKFVKNNIISSRENGSKELHRALFVVGKNLAKLQKLNLKVIRNFLTKDSDSFRNNFRESLGTIDLNGVDLYLVTVDTFNFQRYAVRRPDIIVQDENAIREEFKQAINPSIFGKHPWLQKAALPPDFRQE